MFYSTNILSTPPNLHPSKVSFLWFSPALTLRLGSDHSQVTEAFVLAESEMDDLTAGTSKSVVSTFPKENEVSLSSSQSERIVLSAGPIENTSQVSLVTPQHDTPTAPVKLTITTASPPTKTPTTTTSMPSPKVMMGSTTTTTLQPKSVTRRTITTIRTYTSRRTFTLPNQRANPPRGATAVFVSPFTTTTEAPQPQCNITERLWVKTGKTLEKKNIIFSHALFPN